MPLPFFSLTCCYFLPWPRRSTETSKIFKKREVYREFYESDLSKSRFRTCRDHRRRLAVDFSDSSSSTRYRFLDLQRIRKRESENKKSDGEIEGGDLTDGNPNPDRELGSTSTF